MIKLILAVVVVVICMSVINNRQGGQASTGKEFRDRADSSTATGIHSALHKQCECHH